MASIPFIHYGSREKDYRVVIELLFDSIPRKAIAWISRGKAFCGTFKSFVYAALAL